MKKTTAKKTTKVTKKVRVTKRKVTTPRVVHGPVCDCDTCKMQYGGLWGKERGMMLLLAAATIVLVVAGMWLAGWL